ncbi:hypothetical protein GC176_26390 [bacterium]|nr:hypothetical protein [bacterium]
MRRHGWSIAAAILLAISGCGTDATDPLGDLEIPDLPVAQSASDLSAASESLDGAASSELTGDNATGPTHGDLRFSLQVGDHFPLRKTIEQKLTQKTDTGEVTSQSTLSLMFAISVDAIDEGRRRLTVRYQRVQYAHDILDEHVEYDSQSAPQFVPDSLQVYHGLAGNGFSFWIGADNRIIELLDFDAFLKRCVRHAPVERQAALLEQIVATQQDEGFANFVDDSIGLLPYKPDAEGRETAVAINEQWQRSRRLMRPLPMEIRTTYTLSELTDTLAKVAIVGTIEPIKTAELSPIQQASAQTRLDLRAGYQTGLCIIDRETGLPLRSRVERQLKMNVSVAGQPPVEQYKTIVTTVESYPTHRTTFPASPIGPRIPASQMIQSGAPPTDPSGQPQAVPSQPRAIQNSDFSSQTPQ